MEAKYLNMIRCMKKRGKEEWSVYVLRCGDHSLYTGIAKNVYARLAQHESGQGAAYTRTHLPVKLLYQENGLTRSAALIREAAIKHLPRHRKEKLLCSYAALRQAPMAGLLLREAEEDAGAAGALHRGRFFPRTHVKIRHAEFRRARRASRIGPAGD